MTLGTAVLHMHGGIRRPALCGWLAVRVYDKTCKKTCKQVQRHTMVQHSNRSAVGCTQNTDTALYGHHTTTTVMTQQTPPKKCCTWQQQCCSDTCCLLPVTRQTVCLHDSVQQQWLMPPASGCCTPHMLRYTPQLTTHRVLCTHTHQQAQQGRRPLLAGLLPRGSVHTHKTRR